MEDWWDAARLRDAMMVPRRLLPQFQDIKAAMDAWMEDPSPSTFEEWLDQMVLNTKMEAHGH